MSHDLTNQSANQLLLWGGITVPSYNFIRHVVAEISGLVYAVYEGLTNFRTFKFEKLNFVSAYIIKWS